MAVWTLVVMLCSLMLRWQLDAECCLMLRWQLDAAGDVMLLDVEMAVGRWW
jgi:hypothetical protein